MTSESIEARARALEARVGHPQELLNGLLDGIQSGAVTRFAEIQDDWLRLMWSMDQHRVARVPPRGMGKPTLQDSSRLASVYRQKGNWFATVLAALLQNHTSQVIEPRGRVQGFSQLHQIDLAWPRRLRDPLVCAEAKVTGAPATDSEPARGAMADFSNRRKELKFAATDLKLYRRQYETEIRHWAAWREKAAPKFYFLWAARLRSDRGRVETIAKLLAETQALVNTYLEGAGIFAWTERPDGAGYVPVAISPASKVSDLDDVLYRIASEINASVLPTGDPPPPYVPAKVAVDVHNLREDEETYE